MGRQLKDLMAKELASRYAGTENCLIIGYHGVTAQEEHQLRRALQGKNLKMQVLKNSLAARAFGEIGLDRLTSFLDGPSAIVSGETDVVDMCKAVSEWAREHEKLSVRGGLMNGQAISAEDAAKLARIPPLEVLHAQVLAGIQGPMVYLANAFGAILSQLGRTLDAIRRKKEEEDKK